MFHISSRFTFRHVSHFVMFHISQSHWPSSMRSNSTPPPPTSNTINKMIVYDSKLLKHGTYFHLCLRLLTVDVPLSWFGQVTGGCSRSADPGTCPRWSLYAAGQSAGLCHIVAQSRLVSDASARYTALGWRSFPLGSLPVACT